MTAAYCGISFVLLIADLAHAWPPFAGKQLSRAL
jgi:hypothetical protein